LLAGSTRDRVAQAEAQARVVSLFAIVI
jgi:hypothetical protein